MKEGSRRTRARGARASGDPIRGRVPAPAGAAGGPGPTGAGVLPEPAGTGDASGLDYLRQFGPTRPLAAFLEAIPRLSDDERSEIVEKALILIEQVYVHLTLKRAMHAIDPLQRLRLLRQRLKTTTDRGFHSELILIFISLRDLHTLYVLPAPYQGQLAFLPFLVEEFFSPGSEDPRYLVSKVVPGLDGPEFRPGVEVTHWNGVPIARAIELNADRQGGSNPDARRAQGVAELTVRPMAYTAPPDEDWVRVGYSIDGGPEKERLFPWLVIEQLPAMAGDAAGARAVGPGAAAPPRPGGMVWVGMDAREEAVRRARKVLFAAAAMAAERAVAPAAPAAGMDAARSGIDARGEATRRGKKALFAPGAMADERATAARAAGPVAALPGLSAMPDNFRFRKVTDARGRDYGYLRIFSFNFAWPTHTDADFAAEFRRIITRLLPQDGLIIDVRGNGGGIIAAGERSLQFLTPKRIEPERFHFKNSPMTLAFCDRMPPNWGLGAWKESIGLAIETGEVFSQGFPITPEGACNDIGQVYQGPVVLIIDALCYSTTDMFAAGFQDHEIGPILGVHGRTGAGGANVWDYNDVLNRYLPDDFPMLPQQARFTVAIRRSTRVGAMAGVPLEDLGVSVPPGDRHYTTRDDLMHENRDLIARAMGRIAEAPSYSLDGEVGRTAGGGAKVKVKSGGVSRLDFYLDDRPMATRDVKAATTSLVLADVPPGPHSVKVQGFDGARLVVARTIPLD